MRMDIFQLGVYVLIQLTTTAMAYWEPLLVYNVTHARSLSPFQAFFGKSSNKTTYFTLDEQLPTVMGDAPYVSPLISTWSINPPSEVQIKAVNYENGLSEVLHTVEVTIRSNAVELDLWLKTSALTNSITERARIDLQCVGAEFKYEYVLNATTGPSGGGMALLWDEKMALNKALLLTTRERLFGDINDIRYNMEEHTALFTTPSEQMETTPGERINSTNLKIALLSTVTIGDSFTSITYELDAGVILSSVAVNVITEYNGSIKHLELHHSNGVITTLESKDSEDTFDVGDISNGVQSVRLKLEQKHNIQNVRTRFTYSYLPYDSAQYFVIQGFFNENSVGETTPPAYVTTSTSVPSTSSPKSVPTILDPATSTTSMETIPTLPIGTDPSTTSAVPISSDPLTTSLTSTSAVPISSDPLTTGIATNSTVPISSDPLTTGMTSTSAVPISSDLLTTRFETTSAVSQTTPFSSCTQNCSCKKAIWDSIDMASLIASGNKTAIERILKLVAELKFELKVNKSTLTSYRIKKVSAMDMRTSVNGIGSFGVVVIVGAVFAIVFLDLATKILPK